MSAISKTSSFRQFSPGRVSARQAGQAGRIERQTAPRVLRASQGKKTEFFVNWPVIRSLGVAGLSLGATAFALGSRAPAPLVFIESIGTYLAFMVLNSTLSAARQGRVKLHLRKPFLALAILISFSRLCILSILGTVLENSQGRSLTPEEMEMARTIQPLSLLGALIAAVLVIMGLGARKVDSQKTPPPPPAN